MMTGNPWKGTRLAIALAGVLWTAVTAVAGEVQVTRLTVKRSETTGDTVTVKGKLTAWEEIDSSAAVEFHCGEASAPPLDLADVPAGGNGLSYRAPTGSPGIQKFTLSGSGSFSISVKGVDVGTLAGPIPLTLDIGGQRLTGLFELGAAGAAHSWKKGQPIQNKVRGRILRVSTALANAVLTPISGTAFVRNDSEDQAFVFIGDYTTTTGAEGDFTVTIQDKDGVLPTQLDLGQVLGEAPGFTRPGIAPVTPGDAGELEVVAFVQARSGSGGTVSAGTPTTFEVTGAAGTPSGALKVPPGAVTDDVSNLSFTPLAQGVELPAPLPEGLVPLAAAEVTASQPTSFAEEAAPTVELSLLKGAKPVDPGHFKGAKPDSSLVPGEIQLYQLRKGKWEPRGKGRYDALTNRIKPDLSDPGTLAEAGPVVYAQAIPSTQRMKGRVVDKQRNPVRGVIVLGRGGSMVSGSLGSFEVAPSTQASTALEVLQVLGQGKTSVRVVSVGEAQDGVTVEVVENAAPVPWQGILSGTVFEADGTTPSPGAEVTISVAGTVTGLAYDDAGTPDEFADDTFSLPDLSQVGVTSYEWALRVPGIDDEIISDRYKGNSILPVRLMLEARDFLQKAAPDGVYTLRVGYTVPGVGDFNLFGGFRVTSPDQYNIEVKDIQLPAAYEGTSAVRVKANAQGAYTKFFRAPLGILMTASGQSVSTGAYGSGNFQHATDVNLNLVLDNQGPPPPSGTWTTRASMPTARYLGGAAVIGGKAHVVGGNSSSGASPYPTGLDAYDPVTNSWTTGASMSTGRLAPAIVAGGGFLYAIGGVSVSGAQSTYLRSVESYDPVTNTWSTMAPMPTARRYAAAGVVNGRILVCGGSDASGDLATVEEYDPQTDSWVTRRSMPAVVAGATTEVVNGILYVIGGKNGNNDTGAVVGYDSGSDSWTTRNSMPTARRFPACAVINGEIYVVGGYVSSLSQTTPCVEIYNPTLNKWRTGTAMPTRRFGHAAIAINGSLFVLGGSNPPSSQTMATVEAYASR